MVKVESCNYNGWKDCVRISNSHIEIIASTQVGPRILRFAFWGEENMFYEAEAQRGMIGGDEWRIYGGHRLWHGPQIGFRPNEPDNEPITYTLLEDLLRESIDQENKAEAIAEELQKFIKL